MAKGKSAAKLTVDVEANVAKLATDMGKAVNILGDFQKKVTSMNSTLKGLFAFDVARTVIPEVIKLSGVLSDLADEGEKVGSIRDAFNALGGSASELEKAQKATLGTVSAFDLMATANQGLLRGIPEFNSQFGKMAELAQRFADSTGKDTEQVLEQLTQALAKGKAKGLEPFGFALDGIKNKADVQKTALSQLDEVINRLAPSLDSASNAKNAFNVALDDSIKKMGIGVNSSDTLTRAYRKLEEQINELDWEKVGQDIANIGSSFITLATVALPPVLAGLEKIGYALDYHFGTGATAKYGRLSVEIDKLKKSIETTPTLKDASIFDMFRGRITTQGSKDAALEDLKSKESELKKITESWIREDKEARDAREQDQRQALIDRASFERKLSEDLIISEGKKRVDEIGKLKEAFEKEVSTLQKKSLEDSVNEAINLLDTGAFQTAANNLKEAYKKGIIEAHQESISKGAVSFDAVEKYAEESAQFQADKYKEKFDKAIQDKTAEEQRAAEDAYKNSVNSWRNFFSDAINGGGQDLENILSEIAIGFGAELAAAISGDATAKSMADLGGSLAKGIADLFKQDPSSSESGGIGGLFSSLFGQSTEDAHAAGISGPGMANGQFGGGQGSGAAGYIGPVISVIQSGLSAKKKDSATKSNAGTGGAVGGGLGAVAGGILGGPAGAALGAALGEAIGSAIGGMIKWGSQDPETIARHAFANYVEKSFEKMGQVSFFGMDGKLKNQKGKDFNFIEGSNNRFNTPDWAKSMDSWGDKAKTTFLGLGEALKLVQGITEDVGGQIGFLLGENLSGNIDNARLLVQQLGLDFGDLEQALIDAGKNGLMSWHEVEVNLQGVAEAFKPGLEAVGAVNDALNELLGSGGRGMAAIKGVKDLAVETLEAGGKSLGDLQKKLLEQGADPAVVDAIMKAIEQRGIKTLEALANADERIAGGIVADIYSGNKAIADQWDKMSENLKNMKSNLEELPKEVDIKINFTSNMDENTKAAIDSGVIQDPSSGISAPSLPQTSSASLDGGKVARSARANLAALNVHIDARGAQRGVEADIKNAMAMIEARAVRKSMAMMGQVGDRG